MNWEYTKIPEESPYEEQVQEVEEILQQGEIVNPEILSIYRNNGRIVPWRDIKTGDKGDIVIYKTEKTIQLLEKLASLVHGSVNVYFNVANITKPVLAGGIDTKSIFTVKIAVNIPSSLNENFRRMSYYSPRVTLFSDLREIILAHTGV